jgi:hypothetical protein
LKLTCLMVKILFTEVQGFRRNPLWTTCLLLPAVAMISLLGYQLISGKLVGDKPMSNVSLGILCVCYIIPLTIIFPKVKLTTIIDEEKIMYGWNIPTPDLNVIELANIKEWSIIEYKFVGYGYRLSRLYGTVYNVSGNKGLQVTTKGGDKALIGTGRALELKQIMEKLSRV